MSDNAQAAHDAINALIGNGPVAGEWIRDLKPRECDGSGQCVGPYVVAYRGLLRSTRTVVPRLSENACS